MCLYLFSREYIVVLLFLFFFNYTATTEIYTLSLHDALPISGGPMSFRITVGYNSFATRKFEKLDERSEEHTSELQSPPDRVCRLLLEKKKRATTRGTAGRATQCAPRRARSTVAA